MYNTVIIIIQKKAFINQQEKCVNAKILSKDSKQLITGNVQMAKKILRSVSSNKRNADEINLFLFSLSSYKTFKIKLNKKK